MHHKAELFKLAPSKVFLDVYLDASNSLPLLINFFDPYASNFFKVGDRFIQLSIFIFDAAYKDTNELFVIITDIY